MFATFENRIHGCWNVCFEMNTVNVFMGFLLFAAVEASSDSDTEPYIARHNWFQSFRRKPADFVIITVDGQNKLFVNNC